MPTTQITAAISLPWSGELNGKSLHPAILQAMDFIQSSEMLPDHTLNFVQFNDNCDGDKGEAIYPRVHELYDPDVYITNVCKSPTERGMAAITAEQTTSQTASQTASLTVPVLSSSDADSLTDSSISRLPASLASRHPAVLELARANGWSRVAILVDNTDEDFQATSTKLQEQLEQQLVQARLLDIQEDVREATLQDQKLLETDAYVVLSQDCTDIILALKAMKLADELKGNAVLSYYSEVHTCFDGVDSDIFAGVWTLSPSPYPSAAAFLQEIRPLDADFFPYSQFPFGTADPVPGVDAALFQAEMDQAAVDQAQMSQAEMEQLSMLTNSSAVFLYDSIVLYATAMHKMLSELGVDVFAGAARPSLALVNRYIRETGLSADVAKSGMISLDESGEREVDIVVKYLHGRENAVEAKRFALFSPVGETGVHSEIPLTYEVNPASVVWAGGLVGGPDSSVIEAASTHTNVLADYDYIVVAASVVAVLALYLYCQLGKKKERDSGENEDVEAGQSRRKKMSPSKRAFRERTQSEKFKRMESALSKVAEALEIRTAELETARIKNVAIGDHSDNPDVPCISIVTAGVVRGNMLLKGSDLKYTKGDHVRGAPYNDSVKLVGKGAYGNVVLATYHGTEVAVKQIKVDKMNKSRSESLKNEIKFMQRIRHPFIITCVGFVQDVQEYFLVVLESASKGSLLKLLQADDTQARQGVFDEDKTMFAMGENDEVLRDPLTIDELAFLNFLMKQEGTDEQFEAVVDGMSVREERNEKQFRATEAKWKISWAEKVQYLMDIVTALEFVHGQSVLHRDLKCDNVLVTDSNEAKLADFGTSLQFESADEKRLGKREGTVIFMAPEIISAGKYGLEADVWSFGVMCVEVASSAFLVRSVKRMEWIDQQGQPIEGDCEGNMFAKRLAWGYRPDWTSASTRNPFWRAIENRGSAIDLLLEVAKSCLKHEPQDRPSFSDIKKELKLALLALRMGRTRTEPPPVFKAEAEEVKSETEEETSEKVKEEKAEEKLAADKADRLAVNKQKILE